MRADIDTTSYFKQVASALDLNADESARAWDMMTKANVGRDDPTSVMFCILAKTGGLTSGMADDLRRQNADLLDQTRAGLSEDIRSSMIKALSGVQKDVSTRIAGGVEKTLSDLVSNVDMLVRKEADRRNTIKLAQIAGGIAFVIALTFCGAYSLGRDSINADAARVETFLQRSDATAAMKVLAVNDWNRVLADCGAVGQFEFRGSPACKPTILLGPSLNSVEGINGLKLLWTQGVVKIGSWGLLAVGAVAGAFGGLSWARRKRPGY